MFSKYCSSLFDSCDPRKADRCIRKCSSFANGKLVLKSCFQYSYRLKLYYTDARLVCEAFSIIVFTTCIGTKQRMPTWSWDGLVDLCVYRKGVAIMQSRRVRIWRIKRSLRFRKLKHVTVRFGWASLNCIESWTK